jgi:maltose/moltooligosaccharide transporter
MGQLASYVGRKRTILIGVALLTSVFASAYFFKSFSPLILVLFALAGIGWAAINVNSYPMVVELSRGSNIGKYTGYYYTFSMLAQVVTPILSGYLLEHIGYHTLFPYGAVFAGLSFVTMLLVRHGDAKPAAKKLEAYEEM